MIRDCDSFFQAPTKPDVAINTTQDYITTIAILESLQDAVFIVNSAGTIEYANTTSLVYLHSEIDQVIGRSIQDYFNNFEETDGNISNDHSLTGANSYLEQLEQLLSEDHETEMLGRENTLQVLISLSLVRGKDGAIQYGILMAKDISYRKYLERELQLQQTFLISYDRMRTLNEMSIGLVHELGQPVTTLMLQIDQLMGSLSRSAEISDPVNAQFAGMKDQMTKISGFVERLRNYAQSVGNAKHSPMDMNTVVDAAVAMVEYKYRDARVDLIVEKSPDLPDVTANRPELEHVLVSLLNNARESYVENQDAAHEGPRQVRISTSIEGNNSIAVCIYDHAGGIPQNLSRRIFEPYFTTRDSELHTGTGLSTARSIVNSLGGDISMQPLADTGSVFIIRIPLTEMEERKQLIGLIEMLHNPHTINPESKRTSEHQPDVQGVS